LRAISACLMSLSISSFLISFALFFVAMVLMC
jgi:hypothetical protein